ncbi:unnamed protein product [Acanthoscelides obtectus]|uniref:Uncharacterized protein n=1 Tax=Acanthoscelides obtectus TaxID=200917 RepID=A0A9P0JQ55_ACAOB|nr:unnamed protein product [Acanthoscelides obtectus]CAK1628912.1 hypothetical protein AOBTE_LOCUS5463 [Acanthoscelides obtectus]
MVKVSFRTARSNTGPH